MRCTYFLTVAWLHRKTLPDLPVGQPIGNEAQQVQLDARERRRRPRRRCIAIDDRAQEAGIED